ncbi:phosphatase PAP2 family protein [Nocardioides massiliensis]|uniref:Undecaprenyl-diphosphatase n=1 Tax=Nocardioides massiliensis TaxID=1325935 RepID=A0ABT9NRA7_9ACTN|nr:phosphatase PAP2 family protein [Nocardioides massiliensis]MDP9822966.1 undecaprenyl-diphosphatase [Nocardioides massiliensis]
MRTSGRTALRPRRGQRWGQRVASDEWSTEVSSGYALAGFLTLVLVAFTLLAMGPMTRIDVYFNLDPAPGRWRPLLTVLDRIGQRAVCLPILAVVAVYVARRAGTWRPVLVAAGGVVALNLVVLVLKLAFGRSFPLTADPSFFTGGMAYPSGHGANVLFVYGLVPYLLARYLGPRRGRDALLWAGVAVLSTVMVVVSLTLNWHWFADLVAGLLVGAIVLQLVEAVDRSTAPI